MSLTTAVLTLEGEVRWKAQAGSGHTVIIDGPTESGGGNAGFRPMELMLISLGACMGYDTLMILRRMRQEVTGYRIELSGERAEEPPAVYTSVVLTHVVEGRGISEQAVGRALELAETRYCSAWAMFSKTAKLTNRYEVERVP